MTVQAVFVVLLMFATVVNAQKGGATFWKKKVTLTCPREGVWYGKKINITATEKNSFEFPYQRQGQYSCKYKQSTEEGTTEDVTYHFYVKGKTCENCFELDAKFFLVIIVVDLIGTAVLMMIIYRCSKRKSSDEPPSPSKPPSRPGNRAPYGPSSDYETLNPHTRSVDTYSTVVNRTG